MVIDSNENNKKQSRKSKPRAERTAIITSEAGESAKQTAAPSPVLSQDDRTAIAKELAQILLPQIDEKVKAKLAEYQPPTENLPKVNGIPQDANAQNQLTALGPILQLLGIGGQQNAGGNNMIMELMMRNFTDDIAFSSFFKKAMMQKIAGEAAKEYGIISDNLIGNPLKAAVSGQGQTSV